MVRTEDADDTETVLHGQEQVVSPPHPVQRLYHSGLVPGWMREEVRRRRERKELLESITLPPTAFSEKVRYRMVSDRRRILVTFADRVAVREYVRDKVGSELLTKLYAITDEPEKVVRSDLPREFVLKASHGSGGMIIVGDHAPRQKHLPPPPVGWDWLHVHPDSLDWSCLIALCRHWLALRYRPYREWAYSEVKPRILVEELLCSDWRNPVEYKFFVFGGTARLVSVLVDRFGHPRRSWYSPCWESLDVESMYPRGAPVTKPAKLNEMITVAERLAAEIDFVRVDLYNIGERVVFGEMTNYPEGGWASFNQPEFDEKLGKLWLWDGA